MNSPILPTHPLDAAGVVKIALGQAASEALKGLGKHCLLITAPADATAPEHLQNRIIVHALPITKELANDAYHVATGTHRAAKIRTPKP